MPTPLETLFTAIHERIRATARVETIVGEARQVEGRSLIPVAQLRPSTSSGHRYGFGAGAGSSQGDAQEGAPQTPGGGGGGGVSVRPVGFLVVSPAGERFIPVTLPRRKLAAAGALGFALGYVIGRRVG